MIRVTRSLAVLCLIAVPSTALLAQTDTVKYVPKYYDPTLEQMEDEGDSLKEVRDSITDEIRDRQEEQEEVDKENKRSLRFDFANVAKPESPEAFTSEFHFPPVAQYRTGTCWSFSATSFFESEVARLTGRKIKLSEMHTVYYEWVEKARYYIRERGNSSLTQGSETNAVMRMMKWYGMVPYDLYPGLVDEKQRHDHSAMSREIRNYLGFVKEHDYWDEKQALRQVMLILNKYLGQPPETFEFEGATMTPTEFTKNILKLNPDDYVCFMSTLAFPFYSQGPFEVHDNWWHDSSYYNLPLDEWYQVIRDAIRAGYTLTIGGDVSEPGHHGLEDAAIVPDFDIPQSYINQHSREYRFYNESTGDDHGLHLVGYLELDGRDWYLIKDSGRSGHWGEFEGYYFYRDDYIRLKMLIFTVHKDAVADVLKKFDADL